MMRFLLNKATLVLVLATTISNYALAQTEGTTNIVPIITLLLADEPNMETVDVGEWQGVEIASMSGAANQDQQDHQVVMNEAGNGWVTWRQADGTNPNRYSVWVNNYSAETGWGVAENIETLDYEVETPVIAMNSAGNVSVVWSYLKPVVNSAGVWQLWESHIESDNTTWSDPFMLVSGTAGDFGGRPRDPQLAMDGSGNALLIWRESTQLMSRYYDSANNSWGVLTVLSSSSITPNGTLKLTMNENGQAIAVWQSNITFLGSGGFGVTRPVIKGIRFDDPIVGWVEEQTISFADDTSAIDGSVNPQIAMDSSGNAFVVWSHNKSLPNFQSETNVWARRFSIDNGWEGLNLLETNDFKFAVTPQIAINDSGNAVAVWVHEPEDLASGLKSIWVNHYSSSNGWASAQEIEPFSVWQNNFPAPKIGLDANGNAMAVWLHKQNGVNNLEAIRFDQAANTWGPLEIIGSEDEDTSNPQIATNSLGRVLAIWDVGSFFDPDTLKSNYFK